MIERRALLMAQGRGNSWDKDEIKNLTAGFYLVVNNDDIILASEFDSTQHHAKCMLIKPNNTLAYLTRMLFAKNYLSNITIETDYLNIENSKWYFRGELHSCMVLPYIVIEYIMNNRNAYETCAKCVSMSTASSGEDKYGGGLAPIPREAQNGTLYNINYFSPYALTRTNTSYNVLVTWKKSSNTAFVICSRVA